MKKINLLAIALVIVFSGCSVFNKSSKTANKPDVVAADKTFLTHVVVKNETLHSLSKKYGVSKEEILTLNKDLSTEPKVKIEQGKALRIPIFNKAK